MRKDLLKALSNSELNIHEKINFKTEVLNFHLMKRKISSIQKYDKKFLINYISFIDEREMEIELVEEACFFYGFKIHSIQCYEKRSFLYENNAAEPAESFNEWESCDEEGYYNMTLINGKFWTYCPNLPEIREILIM